MKFYRFQSINKLTLLNLTNQKNWISDPFGFNDPFEFSFYDNVLIDNDKDEFRYLNPIEKKQAEIFKNKINEFGVICYSSDSFNILLWSHYADNHKGMCLVFEVLKKDIHKLHKVNYQNQFPDINLLDDLNSRDEIIKIVTTKSNEWNYENEYREILTNKNAHYKYPGKLTEVIFGCRTPFEDIKMVSNIAVSKDDKIKISRMHIDSLSYSLTKGTNNSNKNFPTFWETNNLKL